MTTVLYIFAGNAIVAACCGMAYACKKKPLVSDLGFYAFISLLLLNVLYLSKSGAAWYPTGIFLILVTFIGAVFGILVYGPKDDTNQPTASKQEEPGIKYENFLQ